MSVKQPAHHQVDGTSRWRDAAVQITSGSAAVTFLAIVLAMFFGAVLIVVSDPDVAEAAKYFFARPADWFTAAWLSVSEAYGNLFTGSIYNYKAEDPFRAIKPLTQTLTWATPLIFAGLGLGIAFRSALFNIGAQGQVILGATVAGYIGFTFDLPVGLHLLVAVSGAILGGAVWAGIAGVLKARTGANEVIVTIMLNSIASYLLAYLLSQDAFQRPGSEEPRSPQLPQTAMFPPLLGERFQLHLGFIVALIAAVLVWWLMERSTLGFQFRAVGANPEAARTAGISVGAVTIWVMVIAGGLAGLAGAAQILGTEGARSGLTSGVAASIGIDAITVALLGRSKPLGIVLSGMLFGALRAGGYSMQTDGVPIDLVLVIQSLIVLFIAAPPLVRAIFRLPAPGTAKPVFAIKEAAA